MKGIIYKLYSKAKPEYIYIGSTKNSLSKRLSVHRCYFNKYLDGNKKQYCSSFKVMKYSNIEIEQIEEVEYEKKKDLRDKEYEYIMKNRDMCVNKYLPRDSQQYYKDNIEKIKQYYQDNKNNIKEYQLKNKEHIREYQKRYRESHKEKQKEYQKKYRENKRINNQV